MTARMLEGKKIAILVETEYIPSEIEAYQTRFAELGATVHFMSRLWGNQSVRFAADVDSVEVADRINRQETRLATLEVNIDFQNVDLNEYAAVIMAANYTSVRLRYFQPPQGQQISPEQTRTAPAVQFFAKAMANPKIIKGLLCHGLWLLTPMPELLKGRRVICHEVVLADITNAGAIYVPPPPNSEPNDPKNIVVDGDMVTGRAGHDVNAFIDAIATQIIRNSGVESRESGVGSRGKKAEGAEGAEEVEGAKPRTTHHSTTNYQLPITNYQLPINNLEVSMTKKILIILSEWGYWGEELIGPLETFDAAGYQVDFATPTGKRPVALTPSMDATFVDPPLGRPVVSQEMAEKVRAIDDPNNPRLNNPISLRDWLPERPYWSSPKFLREMEAYYRRLEEIRTKDLSQYDSMLIVGGSGPLVDLVNNQRVHDLILNFYQMDKPIAAECYGVPCLAFARDINDRKSIIWGKHVTGHCLEYDYKDGTGFMGANVNPNLGDINFGPPFYPLEYILRDATGPEGQFHGNVGHEVSVIVDYPFITGRSTPDSYATGQRLVEVLEKGLRRYGW